MTARKAADEEKTTDKTATSAKEIPPKPSKSTATDLERNADIEREKPEGEQLHGGAQLGDPGSFGEPGATLNPSDPAAPNYAFQGIGTDPTATQEIDKGSGVQQPTPVFDGVPAGGAGETEDGAGTWIDEQTALGRRIAFSRGGEESSTTYEEVIPHGASDALANAARQRILRKLEVA